MKLKSIVINKLEAGTYYALLLIENNGKIVSVDSRPSYAMNLALRSNVPIYVERKVFEEANRAIKAAGFLH
jgi:hypothetical protein